MYTCIGSWENGSRYPPYQDAVYTSPHRGHQKFQWEGGPRGGNFQGGGVRFSRSFFQGLWNKNNCFYWWSYINSYIAECFFHSLLVWYSLHVSNMNVIGSWIMPVILLIASYCTIIIVVVFSVLWSCSISLLLTCF